MFGRRTLALNAGVARNPARECMTFPSCLHGNFEAVECHQYVPMIFIVTGHSTFPCPRKRVGQCNSKNRRTRENNRTDGNPDFDPGGRAGSNASRDGDGSWFQCSWWSGRGPLCRWPEYREWRWLANEKSIIRIWRKQLSCGFCLTISWTKQMRVLQCQFIIFFPFSEIIREQCYSQVSIIILVPNEHIHCDTINCEIKLARTGWFQFTSNLRRMHSIWLNLSCFFRRSTANRC